MSVIVLRKMVLLFSLFLSYAIPATGQTTPCDVRALLAREKLVPDQMVQAKGRLRSDAEMQAIFDRTRESLIADISGGAAASSLNPEQALIVARLRSVEFKVIECSADRAATNPGASNKSLQNRIVICSHTRTAPEIALVAALGHELGHSIDLVNLGCRTFRPRPGNKSRLENYFAGAEQNPPMQAFRKQLEEISDAGRSFNECAFRSAEDREKIEQLLRNGRIEMVDAGIAIERNPIRAAFQCVTSNFGGSSLPESQEAAIKGGYFQFGEKSAQIWGARAVGLYAQANPILAAKDALGLMQFVQFQKDLSVKGPSEKERELNEIYFAEPALQRALRCQPSEKQNCMRHLQFGSRPQDSRPSGALPASQ